MTQRFFIALAALSGLAVLGLQGNEPRPVPTAARPAVKANDPLVDLLQGLHSEEVAIEGNINDIPLFELLQRLSKRQGITFIINEESFKAAGIQDVKSKTANLAATQLRGLDLHRFLTCVLSSMGATYMVKGNTIEIVPPLYAARMAKTTLIGNDEAVPMSLREPLVSAVYKDRPLNEAIAAIAEQYDLTAIVAQQVGDAKTGLVTARLLNVPADRALELLALQADLRVIRKGAEFLITSREHADVLFKERIEKERARVELVKFRQMPPPKAIAQPAQLKTDRPLILKLDVVPQPKPKQ